MLGKDVIEDVRRKLERENGRRIRDGEIASCLGISIQALHNWRNRKQVTVRQIVGLIFKARKSAVAQAECDAIRPIVEFFQLSPVNSRNGTRREIFGVRAEGGTNHPYLYGLREELKYHSGIYVFYDSSGRALYTGKARKQCLWNELNLAYNRERSVQQIRRVAHPMRRVQFRTSNEKQRQIRQHRVPLHDLAAYFSAYQVTDGLIGELESLLIRGFANDLLNVRMENFSWNSKD